MRDETQPLGATPGDDLSGLLAAHLTTRAERNVAETESIGRAYDKYIFRARRKKRGSEWLTDGFLRMTHREMFGSIWNWAGVYRTTQLNLGVEPYHIREQIQVLCGDFRYWDSLDSTMSTLEIAARLQNRLTRIHPFQNGNGRHSRLITDIFFYSRNQPLPQWPQIHRMSHGEAIRAQYIAAMRTADEGDYTALTQFIQSCFPQHSS